MAPIHLILIVFAFILAILAALNIGHPRVNLGWLSLAFFFLDLLIK
jgi:hypothetical protein